MGAHGRGNHAHPEFPGSTSITSDPQSQLLYCCKDGSVHTAQRLVCVTGSRGRQVHRTCLLCWWTALGLGITVSYGSWRAGCLAQVRRVPGVRCPAQQWHLWPWQTSAQFAGWSSWRLWCWHQPGFQWQKLQEWIAEASPRCSPDLEVMPSLSPFIIDDGSIWKSRLDAT